MARTFGYNVTTSSASKAFKQFVIPDWFPDKMTNWWDYVNVRIEVTLKIANADYGPLLHIHGGPVSLDIGNSAFWGTGWVNYISTTPIAGGTRDTTLMEKASGSGERGITTGMNYGYGGVVPVGSNFTVVSNTHKDSDLSITTSVAGPTNRSYTQNMKNISNGRPVRFWPVDYRYYTDDHFIPHIADECDLTIDAWTDNFVGDLVSITTSIDRADGTTWSQTRSFDGSDKDTHEPVVIVAQGDAVIGEFTREPGVAVGGLGSTNPAIFDTLRVPGADPASVRNPDGTNGSDFDTYRRMAGDFTSDPVTGLPMLTFDTLRILGQIITDTYPPNLPFDTYRLLGVYVELLGDTLRDIPGGNLKIPVDTMR